MTERTCLTEKDNLKSKIKGIGRDLFLARKEIGNGLQCLREELQSRIEEHSELLLQQSLELDFWRRHLENELDQTKVKTYKNTSQIRQHASPIEDTDTKVRAYMSQPH